MEVKGVCGSLGSTPLKRGSKKDEIRICPCPMDIYTPWGGMLQALGTAGSPWDWMEGEFSC